MRSNDNDSDSDGDGDGDSVGDRLTYQLKEVLSFH